MTDDIEGVLPYIAPEVLGKKPYTKQSEVYSLSMIMWELTSGKPPFTEYNHDIDLALLILDGKRPEIVEGTPDFYSNIMMRCWDANPENRIQPSLLPKLFEEMLDLCKFIDNSEFSKVSIIPTQNFAYTPMTTEQFTTTNRKGIEPGKVRF